jgi:inositol phosphorylceramide synthase catalytic subunit
MNLKNKIFDILPFIGILLLYRCLSLFPNYKFNKVIIGKLYDFEIEYFGVNYNGIKLTLNEYLQNYQNNYFDIICGLTYLLWIPLPFFFALYLIFMEDKYLINFYKLMFTITLLTGFIIYYVFPAAPPWYYQQFGDNFYILENGNASFLERFDKLLGLPIYNRLYSMNTNVYAAMPSLHCAIPFVCYLTCFKLNKVYYSYFFLIISILTIFSALYGNQHYFIDIIIGMLISLIGFYISLKCIK